MRPLLPLLALLLAVPIFAAEPPPAATPSAPVTDAHDSQRWPRQFKDDAGTGFTLYQPQLDAWDGFTLTGRAAVAVQPADSKAAPIYGVLSLSAQTNTDRTSREVAFEKLSVTAANFPSAPDQADAWRRALAALLPTKLPAMPLDQLEASLAVVTASHRASAATLRNDPPAIVFSSRPALLVLIDGEPQWRKIPGSSLERAINTHALLLRETSGRLFVHLWEGYVEAASLAGPWKPAAQLPADLARVEQQLVAAKQVDLLAGQADPKTKQLPSLKGATIPDLRLATVPTELIVTQGEPKWTPIPSTQLLFVENTPAHVFKHLADQSTYVVLSGRWFKAPGFSGPWTHVSAAQLPADFAAIPDNSPQENVKASVPGTAQAKEALIANAIPQTERIDRTTTTLDPAPAYDGAPKLEKIAGTPLSYAVNSATPVIQVDDRSWFACRNGVWFSASSSAGPWAVATSVPAVIYTIPFSSPLHYVTYVRVYRYDDRYVWSGYTPGYYGTVIGPDDVVVYGTGYAYAPYVGDTVYVAYPVTYGYSTNACWTPWAGWCFGFAVGWAWSDDWWWWAGCPPAPYWGPYWGYCYGWGYNGYGGITAWGPYGWAGTSGIIHTTSGDWNATSRAAAGYNGLTGNQWAAQYGQAYNSVTGTRVVGQRGAVENVYTGNYAYGGRGIAHNDNTGITAAGGKHTAGNANTGREVTTGHATVYNPNTGDTTHIAGGKGSEGNAVLDVNGNVIAGHDGHVYQRNDDGSWTQLSKPTPPPTISGSTREPAERPAAPDRLGQDGAGQRNPDLDRGNFDRELQSRDLGARRTDGFQRSGGGFGGGGRLGGGGGGRLRR